MNKKELKKKLHNYIDNLDDETTLQMLNEVTAEYGTSNETVGLDELTTEQLARLKKSQEQLRNGNTYTHEEVQKKVKKWLSK